MAKQCGSHPFTGKMGATIGYQVNGEFLERENGSKEGKAFRKDPRRRRTMYYAGLFNQASKAMVVIYRALPANQRKHGVYGKLTGKAFSLLRLGKTIEEVKEELTRLYVTEKLPLVSGKPDVQEPVRQQRGSAAEGRATDSGAPPYLLGQPAPGGNQVGGAIAVSAVYVVAIIEQPNFYSTVS